MREIKFDKLLLGMEVNSLSNAGNSISTQDSEISADDVRTLQTCVKYIEQQKKIAVLLELYKRLINKDVLDINEMQRATFDLDMSISKMFK